MINSGELLFSVDEYNNPIPPQPRALSHKTGIWHRTCHIWIINLHSEILCQQRSLLKDTNPGNWEAFFGGHLSPGQSYVESAITELREELGLTVSPSCLRLYTEHRDASGTEYQGIFILEWNGSIASLTLEKDEVEQVSWKATDEVRAQIVDRKDTGWTSIGYEDKLLNHLTHTHPSK